MPETSDYFPQSLQANAGIVAKLSHDRLLPNPSRFNDHFVIRRYVLRSADSVVKINHEMKLNYEH
jgi:hypothetical protein